MAKSKARVKLPKLEEFIDASVLAVKWLSVAALACGGTVRAGKRRFSYPSDRLESIFGVMLSFERDWPLLRKVIAGWNAFLAGMDGRAPDIRRSALFMQTHEPPPKDGWKSTDLTPVFTSTAHEAFMHHYAVFTDGLRISTKMLVAKQGDAPKVRFGNETFADLLNHTNVQQIGEKILDRWWCDEDEIAALAARMARERCILGVRLKCIDLGENSLNATGKDHPGFEVGGRANPESSEALMECVRAIKEQGETTYKGIAAVVKSRRDDGTQPSPAIIAEALKITDKSKHRQTAQ